MTSRPERLQQPAAPFADAPDGADDALFSGGRDATLQKVWQPVFELLEDRRLMDGEGVFRLDFDAAAPGTLVDKDGEGVGFGEFQQNKNDAGFRADLLDLVASKGILQSTTTGGGAQGSNFQNDNSHANLLQTRFDATTSGWTVDVRLRGPGGSGPITQFDGAYKQAGIFVGSDQDNYVKLVVGSYAEGPRIEFADEYTSGNTGQRVHQTLKDVGSFANYDLVDLRLVGDAADGTVQAFYRTAADGQFARIGTITVPALKRGQIFKADGEAGIIQSSRFASGPVTAVYDHFEITQPVKADGRPTVLSVSPAGGQGGVGRDSAIFANVQSNTAGSRIDPASLTSSTVRLINTKTGQPVSAEVKTSGAGDVIVLSPKVLLDATTTYRFEITDGVRDSLGQAMVPFTSTFTTGTQGGEVDGSIKFDRSAPAIAGEKNWTGLTFGPDGRLYATAIDGLIFRFDVAPDGTLSNRTQINTVRQAEGFRAITGLTFDPASTADDLVAYISHGAFEGIFPGQDAPEWSGKLSKLYGPDLGGYQEMVVGLPRSVGDHLNNQPVFGPDGKIYFSQAANTAMGAPDPTWSEADGTPRPERLLTAAILQVDVAAIGAGTVNVRTEGVPSPYNPFAPDAPVKLYATGVRNAYDLIWHSNGTLYAPTNGSGSGGYAPASPAPGSAEFGDDRTDDALYGPLSGPAVPGLTNVPEVQSDFLFRVTPGGYYGSPNPLRDEWVLNGGNPTAATDAHEVAAYPEGTAPDRNWRLEDVVYDFGKRISSNGVIEYRDDASTGTPFGGALDGKLFVARYSQPQDVVIISLDAAGNVTDARDGFDGLEGFRTPLDLAQQPGTGNVFVADIYDKQIYLLRPNGGAANVSADAQALHFSDNKNNANRSPARRVTVTNTGVGALSLTDVRVTGPDAGRFRVANAAAAPDFLLAGQSFTFEVDYRAGAKGIEQAFLTIGTNDPDTPVFEIKLRGLGTTGEGGQDEPSLQRILDLYEIKTDVGDPDATTTSYPSDATLRGDEVLAPRFTKAGPGAVTLDVLAVMAGAKNGESVTLGTYTPGTAADFDQLFAVHAGSEQTVNPAVDGRTSFDPGAGAFSFYGTFAAFNNRAVHGEGAFNTWENNDGERRKVRVFQLRDESGAIVDNAYVVTFEEWERESDQNDIVFVVRNVAPAVGPVLGVENLDGAPLPDRLVFSRINADGRDTRLPNTVHDRATVRLSNTGENPLTLESVTLDTGDWEIVSGGVSSPVTLAPGQTRDVTLKFVYDRAGLGNEVRQGTLTVQTDSLDQPTRAIALGGLWQSHSEDAPNNGTQEPTLGEIMGALGYSIDVGDVDTRGETVARGDEVLSSYFERVDKTDPVGVRMLAAYHQQFNENFQTRSSLGWYDQGNPGGRQIVLRHRQSDGQTLLPLVENGSGPAYAEFRPAGAFGLKVDGVFSDPTLNDRNYADSGDDRPAHAMRWYAVRDSAGRIVPDTYVVAQDYTGVSYSNYDYQDNVYLLTNVRPTSGPQAVKDLAATGGANVALSWTPSREGNVVGYNVYRAASANGPFTLLTDEPAAGTTFVDADAPQNAQSFYRVAAVDYHGTEGAATAASATRGQADAPAAPSNLQSTAATATTVGLAWLDNSPAETNFTVQRRVGNGAWQTVSVLPANATTFSDSGLAAGTAYEYRVFASNGSGNSAFSNIARVTTAAPATPPAAPTNLAASAGHAGVTLTWADNSDNETGFEVQRRAGTSGAWQTVTTTAAAVTSYADTGLASGATYQYRVRAVNAAGQSAFGDVATATTTTAATPPAAPTNLAGTATATGVTLTWADNSGDETGFVVERRTVGGAWATLATPAADATSFADTNLSPETAYEYRVAAANAAGTSVYSNVAKLTTAAAPTAQGYASDDIGPNVTPGRTTVATPGRDFDVVAGGTTLFDTQDSFRFVHTALTGDFDVVVRVDGYDPAAANSRVGLMARDGTGAGARHAAMSFDGDFFRLYHRDAPGQRPGVRNRIAASDVEFVRLKRDGATFTGYFSADGANWSEHGRVVLDMPQTLRVGMFASATSTRDQSRVEFRDLSVNGSAAPQTVPAAPTNLVATARAGGVDLAWSDNATNEQGYRVLRRIAGNGAFAAVATLNADAASWADNNVTPGASYDYRVVAFNAAGEAMGGSVRAEVPSPPASAPAAPTGLTATATANGVALEWFDNSDDETGFTLQRRVPGGQWSAYVSLAANATSYFDTAAGPGSTYEYRVAATNAAGASANSNAVSVTTPAAQSGLTSADVGNATPGSTTELVPGVSYDVVGGGTSLWGTQDSFRLVSRRVTGDFDISVRVADYDPAAPNSRVGLMARDGTTSTSARFAALSHDGDRWIMYHRGVGGAHTGTTNAAPATRGQPGHVRLVRQGDTFITYHSTDGQNWTEHGRATLAGMPQTLDVGGFVSASSTDRVSHVGFRDFAGFPATDNDGNTGGGNNGGGNTGGGAGEVLVPRDVRRVRRQPRRHRRGAASPGGRPAPARSAAGRSRPAGPTARSSGPATRSPSAAGRPT